MNSIDKRNYLLRTLSRTNRKNFENYVVNRIWNKLDNLEIKPVSQQYVKRDDGGYALLDLYFPQINLGIECDESYHKMAVELDRVREVNVEKALSAINRDSGFTLIRIDASVPTMEEFNKQIDDAVSAIMKKYKEMGSPKWSEELSPVEAVKKRQCISAADPYYFSTIVEVGRLFGKDYKSMQRCAFTVSEESMVWCPKLAIVEDGKRKAASKSGWINWLSENWNEIYEGIPDNSRHTKPPKKIKRIVFAKSKNSLGENVYKFIGCYRFEKQIENDSVNVYRLESREYHF